MALIAYYKLDTDAVDYGPSGYDLTANGDAIHVTTGQINGAGKVTDVGNGSWSRSLTTEFNGLQGGYTLNYWMRFLDTAASFQDLIRCIGTYTLFTSYFTSANLKFSFSDTGGGGEKPLNIPLSSLTLDTDQLWHMITMTWDSTNIRAYVDGVLVGTSSDYSAFQPETTPTSFQICDGDLDGEFDEVRVYNTVLTQTEITELYLYEGIIEVEIAGVDYSMNFYDFQLDQKSIYASSKADIMLYDGDLSIGNAITRFKEIKVYYSGILEFTGLIIDIDNGDNISRFLDLYCVDYWWVMLISPVTATYADQPWSAILTDIVNNNPYVSEYSIGISKIDTTVNLESRIYVGKKANIIAIEACMAEDYVAFIDESKDLVFKSNIKDDTGIHLNYADGDMRSYDFKRTGGDIITTAIVRGKPGSPPNNAQPYVIVDNDEIRSTFDVIIPEEFNRPELTTDQQCADWGEREIKRRNESQIRGNVAVNLNMSLVRGKLITLTIAEENLTAQTFYIVGVSHDYQAFETSMDLVYYSRNSVDFINEILRTTIETKQYLTDQSAVATRIKKLTEEITVSSHVDVDRRSYSGAIYGEFNYSEKYYGQMSGSWASAISNQVMNVTNAALSDFLRLLAQIATIPDTFEGDRAHIGLGTGSTVVTYDDTSLEGETYRLSMEAGNPNGSDTGELEFEIVFGDQHAITATFNNVGLFNASSSGLMASAIVLSNSISKAADEEIRFKIRLKFTAATYLTTTGANLIRDILANFSTDYLNNANAAIEIITTAPTTYREGMEASHPKFINETADTVRFQTDIEGSDVSGGGFDGETFIIMDLYNKTSGGVQVIDGTVGSTVFNQLQDLWAQIQLKLVR